jgi:hypothetical protein
MRYFAMIAAMLLFALPAHADPLSDDADTLEACVVDFHARLVTGG